jgi:hypothetical protein
VLVVRISSSFLSDFPLSCTFSFLFSEMYLSQSTTDQPQFQRGGREKALHEWLGGNNAALVDAEAKMDALIAK